MDWQATIAPKVRSVDMSVLEAPDGNNKSKNMEVQSITSMFIH